MHQLVYMSRAKRKMTEAELQGLCATASSRNADRDVTGLLLYDGVRFIQALEGPQDQVEQVMQKIAVDPRHDELSIMSDRPVESRQFGSWAMDYQLAPTGCCSQEFLSRVKSDVAIVEDSALKAAFIGFALLGNRSLAGYRCTAG